MYGTKAKGTRYLEMAEGYVTGDRLLDKDDQVMRLSSSCHLGKMMDAIKKGMSRQRSAMRRTSAPTAALRPKTARSSGSTRASSNRRCAINGSI